MSEYIFKNVGGKLEYVGDFEGFYINEKDPWEQSGSEFHKDERYKLAGLLSKYKVESLLVVGSGLGYEAGVLQQLVCNNTAGVDISKVAVEKARVLFPYIPFRVVDIRKEGIPYFDMVVLSSMLWYILPELDRVIQNVSNTKYLVITQAFIDNQRYGREIIDGFGGLVKYIWGIKDFELINAQYEKGKKYNVGTVILQKRV